MALCSLAVATKQSSNSKYSLVFPSHFFLVLLLENRKVQVEQKKYHQIHNRYQMIHNHYNVSPSKPIGHAECFFNLHWAQIIKKKFFLSAWSKMVATPTCDYAECLKCGQCNQEMDFFKLINFIVQSSFRFMAVLTRNYRKFPHDI